jgi:hypothetical protein
VISALSLGQSTTVTTIFDNDFVVGQLCRLLIPFSCGARQLNEQAGYITSLISSTQFVLNIDSSRNVNAFIATPTVGNTLPQVIPVGDVNTGQINTGPYVEQLYIPGSFTDISPN